MYKYSTYHTRGACPVPPELTYFRSSAPPGSSLMENQESGSLSPLFHCFPSECFFLFFLILGFQVPSHAVDKGPHTVREMGDPVTSSQPFPHPWPASMGDPHHAIWSRWIAPLLPFLISEKYLYTRPGCSFPSLSQLVTPIRFPTPGLRWPAFGSTGTWPLSHLPSL
jgi:hypothetical protein